MIYLCIPSGGDVIAQLLRTTPNAGSAGTFAIDPNRMSAAAMDNANGAWCKAWNDRYTAGWTKFAINHADVEPDIGFLDTMSSEMDRVGADILSVVIPIKDGHGIVSAGILGRDQYTRIVQRFSMAEIFDLPETFSIEDTHRPNDILVVNTGLSMYRIDPWFGEFPGFNLLSQIQKEPDGTLVSRFWPEDWEMSRWADSQGLKVFGTRKVGVDHWGRFAFSNRHVWGKWKTDEMYKP